MPQSLFAKVSIVFFCVLLVLGLFSIWVSHQLNQEYFLESHQQLNSPIAMYMSDHFVLVDDGKPDPSMLAALSQHVMVLNPSITAYLLDNDGTVLAPDTEELQLNQVSLDPINAFLREGTTYPLLGDNPANGDTQNIFSVWPLTHHSIDDSTATQVGYVYVVLNGERYKSLLASVYDSFSRKSLVALLVGATALALLCGIFVFFQLTRRLRQLTLKAHNWLQNNASEHNSPIDHLPDDEIDALALTYDSMAEQLMTQCHRLEKNDQQRREFFANISHDLRTPLTTMQSYLETLVLKQDTLDAATRNRYVRTAHRQSTRLRRLIMQLFELSQLTSREINLNTEPFSLLELSYDCVQDFALSAKREGIEISVVPENDETASLDVKADIALIQRVLQNLISNAIRYTPADGSIKVLLSRTDDNRVTVSVSDTGSGMPQERLDQIFERHYPGIRLATSTTINTNTKDGAANQITVKEPVTRDAGSRTGGNAGLGLAIVKHILKLHKSDVSVQSTVGVGTTFSFALPAARTQAASHQIAV